MTLSNDLTYYHDINFEWLASHLIDVLEVNLYQMDVKSIGIFSRHVNHDVEKVKLEKSEGNNILNFVLNRSGVYDNLPHGVFHKSLTVDAFNDSSEKVKDSIRAENQKEESARSFFQIFESELLKSNVLNRHVVKNAENSDFGFALDSLKLLLPFDIEIFSRDELIRCMQLFPFLNHVYDDYCSVVTEALKYILDMSFDCTAFTRMNDEFELLEGSNVLGAEALGHDLCCGDMIQVKERVFVVYYDAVNIDFASVDEKAKLICEWIIPLYYTIEVKGKSQLDYLFILNDEEII